MYLRVHKTLEEGGHDPNFDHEIFILDFWNQHETIRSHILMRRWSSQFLIQSVGHGYKMFFQDAATLFWCGYKKMINNIVRIQATEQVWAPRSFPKPSTYMP